MVIDEEKMLAYWQKRLCLQDWRIKLNTYCTPDDILLNGAVGSTDWNETIKTARIDILDPKYYGERIVPFSFEKTLVHELLHLKFSFWCQDDGKIEDRLMHQIIDDLARALTESCNVE